MYIYKMLKSWKFQILHPHMDNALIVYCWFVVPTRVSQTNWSTLHTWLIKCKKKLLDIHHSSMLFDKSSVFLLLFDVLHPGPY